jgi:hypothetical protein
MEAGHIASERTWKPPLYVPTVYTSPPWQPLTAETEANPSIRIMRQRNMDSRTERRVTVVSNMEMSGHWLARVELRDSPSVYTGAGG